ncbi:MAG: cation diffusion facilitator family transporter [Candidatus Gastranaerophilales bacterium]|nr:cation diffusion facilitator family transporter [Candidatus Gastranaerophilales bacterium]
MSSDSFSPLDPESSHRLRIEKIEPINKENISSQMAVWRAFVANIGIALIKLISWFFSRSTAMLAEAIHSGVDAFNSLCLIVGLKRGNKPADKLHPYGYGLEANIWTLFACIFMLFGTTVSIYNGFDRMFYHHDEVLELLKHYHLTALILIISILFEMWALTSASLAVLEEAEIEVKNPFLAFFKSFKYIKKIKSATTKFVWYEDTAALSGVIIALVALSISKFVLPQSLAYLPDAIASIIIGCILFALAIYLIKQNVNYLTGAAAGPQTEKLIREIATKSYGVTHLHDLKTMDMGSSGLIVNMKIEVDPETQMKDADDIANKLEEKIKSKIKNISHVTIEMQADDVDDNWNEKLENIIKEGEDLGILKPNEAQMLSKFFDFTEAVVYEIMVPRTEVNFIEVSSSIDELVNLITISGHTRLPVYEDNIDNILGVVNAKDVLRVVKKGINVSIRDLVRDLIIVPENKSISDMLSEFNAKKAQIAAVVDEHGGLAGIVTVEDIIEEIVGEIWDEFDVQIPELIKVNEKTLNIISKLDIEDFNERFGRDLPTEDFQTVGGYVFVLLGREPETGDIIEDNDIRYKVLSMDGHKIVRLLLEKKEGVFVDKQERNGNGAG